MTKKIKIRPVRRKPLDAAKLAAALVELADQLSKQLPEDKDAQADKGPEGRPAHE